MPFSQVNAHVRGIRALCLAEEDQVARIESAQGNGVAFPVKIVSAVGEFYSVNVSVQPDDESRAVHAGAVGSSQAVRCSEEGLGVVPEQGLFRIIKAGSRARGCHGARARGENNV